MLLCLLAGGKEIHNRADRFIEVILKERQLHLHGVMSDSRSFLFIARGKLRACFRMEEETSEGRHCV